MVVFSIYYTYSKSHEKSFVEAEELNQIKGEVRELEKRINNLNEEIKCLSENPKKVGTIK